MSIVYVQLNNKLSYGHSLHWIYMYILAPKTNVQPTVK